MAQDSENKKIAKNTAFLYVRMFVVLIVGLITGRVVLNTLGVDDYGIYNVVGGFVVVFGFLNGAMATASQRFITVEIARGNLEKQRIAFSSSINLHILLSVIIAIIAETVGLWFLNNKLVIPADRMYAAFWVYQFSVASLIISVLSVPYNALIIAHEKMSAFAAISMTDVLLKLVIVYSLTLVSFDKLIFYASLMFGVQLIDRIIYGIYCSIKFPETRYKYILDSDLLKGISNIAGWSIFGNMAGVCYTQGINVLLNMFFGPTVNAARGIAVTVWGAISGFSSNVQMAINPQITKSYAVGNLERMHSLIYSSSKYCFFLMLIIVMPIIIGTDAILTLWLKRVPQYTVWFTRIILCTMLFDTLANPLMIASQAVGKVKVYQSVVGGTLLLILPFSYLSLKLGAIPESVFIIQFVFSLVATLLRVLIVGKLIDLKVSFYVRKVVLRILVVFVTSLTLSVILSLIFDIDILSRIVVTLLCPLITLATILIIGLTQNERIMIINKVKILVHSKIKNI